MTNRTARTARSCRLLVAAFLGALVSAATATTSEPVQRTVRADERQEFPPAMPAAGRIVYTRQIADVFDMFTADPDGANEARLSEIDESAAGEDQPRWSPDGRRISFATFRDGAAAFHIIDARGGQPRTVVVGDGVSGDAAWSPDGRCLVYNGGRAEDTTRFDLKVWCDDGSPDGTRRTLTDTADVDERDPAWSPDGARILFVTLRAEPGADERWTLHSIRPDGTDRSLVLALPDEHIRFPRYDPAGERIGFIGNRQNLPFGVLSTYDPLTGARERLCELASDTWSWSPDGTEIVFANIANSGVRVLDRLFRTAPALVAAPSGLLAAQYKGLYRIDIPSRSVVRLGGAAGGAQAPSSASNFEFGFMPDWTAGTATPTDRPVPSPTTDEPTPPIPATVTPTLTLPPPTITAPPTATVQHRTGRQIYLPRLFRAAVPGRRR